MNDSPHYCKQEGRLVKIETVLDAVVETNARIANTLETIARTEEKLSHVHQMVAQFEVRLLSIEKVVHKQSWIPKVLATLVSGIIMYLIYKNTGVVIGIG